MVGLCEGGNEPPGSLKASKLRFTVPKSLSFGRYECPRIDSLYTTLEKPTRIHKCHQEDNHEMIFVLPCVVRQRLNGAERSTRLVACSGVSTDISKFTLRSSSTTGFGAYNSDTTDY
ncbi:hypothetical protein ANN_05096 [Periplaneta americana]|uniref:Uncharacterized protein n=1 Tax=Periplaneta americana TaxID=6978 RepID=A0ABQ8TA45_PERAM|nr:hypothetical protein ANN_05096 [Periplaneta americana]